MTNMNLFIEPKVLKKKMNDISNIKVLDATFYLPDSGLNAEKEYNKNHITDAIFFDINKIADPINPLPHMIPSKETFSEMMRKLGINNEDEIVIYDNSPFLSSARAWFLFRYFGHKKIFILNGGLKSWIKNNGVTTNHKTTTIEGNFSSSIEMKELVKNLSDMIKISYNQDYIVFDARSYKR